MATLTMAVNVSSSNTAYSESGAAWVEISSANDYLIFSAGSDTVADAQTVPTQAQLNAAGVVLTGSEITVSKYFLADVSEDVLYDLDLMGNQNTRYVLAFDFDDATATEPVLELWDDSNLNTITGTTLGAGTPSNSWWKGVATTNSSPGADWSGFTLAGSSNGHYLSLNVGGGALSVAKTLYCNLKIVIPATATSGTNATPVFAVKYTSN